MINLHNKDCFEIIESLGQYDLMILDPPFQDWSKINFQLSANIICFCNPKSRHIVEEKFGIPKTELVWHFADGRWVSNDLPRITHDYIYIYGQPKSASVGEYQNTKAVKKGNGCIGMDKLGKRIYQPKDQKQLNSVLIYPRNMNNKLGAWSKPYKLIKNLIEWFNPVSVLDPFMGSGVTAEICRDLSIDFTGIEINKEYFDYVKEKLNKEKEQKNLFLPNYQLNIL
jgi:DNA modification methylase